MSLLATFLLPLCAIVAPAETPRETRLESAPFAGIKANTGTVTYVERDGKRMLELSDAFVIPDTPAPHWQVVDSLGRAHLLQRLPVKDMKANRKIELPAHVDSIAKVQIWCAFAETLLGETSFERVIDLGRMHGQKVVIGKTGMFRGVKADQGFVKLERLGCQTLLTLSDDFVVPATPAPHWQVVDEHGGTYLLQALNVKGDRLNRTIALPPYVQGVHKVQIWCAFAETLLGEALLEGHNG